MSESEVEQFKAESCRDMEALWLRDMEAQRREDREASCIVVFVMTVSAAWVVGSVMMLLKLARNL